MRYCAVFLAIFLAFATGQNCPTQFKLVKVSNGYYIASVLRNMNGIIPSDILYDGGDIFYKIDNMTFALYRNANKPVLLRYRLNFKTGMSNYVDSLGNIISKKNVSLQVTKPKSPRTLRVVTEYGSVIGDMAVDMDKERIFFIGYDLGVQNQQTGRLYAFDVQTIDDVAGKIYVNTVDVGDNLMAISVDSSTGEVLLLEYGPEESWSFVVMKNVNIESCKTPRANGINKNALMTSMKIAGEKLIDLYEGAVLGKDDSEVLKQHQNVAFPNGGPVKPNMFEPQTPKAAPAIDNDVDHCGTRFVDMMNEIDSLKAEMKRTKENYNKFYSNVYNSISFKELIDFEKKLAPVPEESVKCNSTLKQMCFVKAHGKILLEAKKILKNTVNWLDSIVEIPEDDLKLSDEIK